MCEMAETSHFDIPTGFSLVSRKGFHVTLRQDVSMSIPQRGTVLMDFEKRLRAESGMMYEIFLESKGDLNALRVKLRGVKLKGD